MLRRSLTCRGCLVRSNLWSTTLSQLCNAAQYAKILNSAVGDLQFRVVLRGDNAPEVGGQRVLRGPRAVQDHGRGNSFLREEIGPLIFLMTRCRLTRAWLVRLLSDVRGHQRPWVREEMAVGPGWRAARGANPGSPGESGGRIRADAMAKRSADAAGANARTDDALHQSDSFENWGEGTKVDDKTRRRGRRRRRERNGRKCIRLLA